MTRTAAVCLAILVAACSSSRKNDELPSTIPPPEIRGDAATATDPRLTEIQTSLTELLDRIDVLNARVAKLESGAPTAAPAPSTTTPMTTTPPRAAAPHTNALQINDEYRRAITLVSQSKHAEAGAAFQRVFDADPSGDLADNALFWIGETLFATGKYNEAMRLYSRVAKEYPDQNKAPDALFKMGTAYVKTGDLEMARRTFEECISRYPYSSPAAAARMELKKIKY